MKSTIKISVFFINNIDLRPFERTLERNKARLKI